MTLKCLFHQKREVNVKIPLLESRVISRQSGFLISSISKIFHPDKDASNCLPKCGRIFTLECRAFQQSSWFL